jgi:ubiquinone/menaquinone biosynthesis C-methylase UbiE
MPRHDLGPSFAASPPENYERYFVPAIGEPVATELLRAAALRPGERVLDVGCGTGIVARLAADAVGSEGSVAGLDVEPGMLAVARSAAVGAGIEWIEWIEASAESIPLPDESIDIVLCQMSLQFVPDRARAVEEMRRVLVPGGRFVLNVPGPTSPFFESLSEALARHVDPRAAAFVERVFSLHDVDQLTALLEGAGFRDVRVEAGKIALSLPRPKDFLWQYAAATPMAGILMEAGERARRELEREVVVAWRDYEVDEGMEIDQRIVASTAVR